MNPDPLWYKTAVFYEVYVRAFQDSDGDGHGDLPGLTSRLDYFKDLGVDCLWLLPIYPSPLRDDGYDIADYDNILETYGTLEDFQTFLDEAHRRGLRVITDLVMNHTSDLHPWFEQAASSRDNPYREYYVWSPDDSRYREARIIFLDTESSNWTWEPVTGEYFWHRFYSTQPDLNYDSPRVRQEMADIITRWLEMGIDGFRADAVPYLFEREGTSCENLPETHAYLKQVRAFIDQRFPGRILLGEANQWPEDVREYFGDGDEFQMNFHFPLMPRIYKSLATADRSPLEWVFERTPAIPDNCQWCTFLRNHDELTLEMVTPEEREWFWDTFAPDPRMRLNLGIRRRLAPLLDNDQRKIRLANALLFSLPGAPIIYYGDEIGMGDNIWLRDRDGVRTPMQWSAGPSAGFSSAPPEKLYYAPISEPPYDPARVNVEAARADPGSLWHFMRRLIALRKSLPVLADGALRWLPAERADRPGESLPSVAAFLRGEGTDSVVAVHNLSGESVAARVADPGVSLRLQERLGEERIFIPQDGWLKFELLPYQSRWLVPMP